MLFLGYLGDIQLAGGSLSIGFANITGYSVIKGLAMGMEPICCQAYGAKRACELGNAPRTAACGVLTGSRTSLGRSKYKFWLLLPHWVANSSTHEFWVQDRLPGAVVWAWSSGSFMLEHDDVYIDRVDWKHQAKRARELTRAAEGHLYDLETSLLHRDP
ncbi:hypothetical protein NE237_003287 [Protea cynaroides]|uniref:Uncharacterized protein n=1 Tax=Protea cynaroides TaxID=273540 RepID=A0A9Q0KGF4_9MAGN|nr:hypothetical protein NE237_003287 [Protea cynaroides]